MTAGPGADGVRPVGRLGILARGNHPRLTAAISHVHELADEHGIDVLFEEAVDDLVPDGLPALELGERAPDVVVVLGGDGTLLRASHIVGDKAPILGVNLGRLGFLTAADENEVEPALERLIAGDYVLDRRFMLRAAVLDEGGAQVAEARALNDFVLHQSGMARVTRIAIAVGAQGAEDEVGSFTGDGVILSTPTGSTAYSLSAGGPIIVPRMECTVVTPICPHTLAVRPLVIPAEERVTVRGLDPSEGFVLTMDGREGRMVPVDGTVVVDKSEVAVSFVRFYGQSFFSTLRRKLNWAARPGEKDRMTLHESPGH